MGIAIALNTIFWLRIKLGVWASFGWANVSKIRSTMPRCLRTGENVEPNGPSVEAKETHRFSEFRVDRHDDPAISCPQ